MINPCEWQMWPLPNLMHSVDLAPENSYQAHIAIGCHRYSIHTPIIHIHKHAHTHTYIYFVYRIIYIYIYICAHNTHTCVSEQWLVRWYSVNTFLNGTEERLQVHLHALVSHRGIVERLGDLNATEIHRWAVMFWDCGTTQHGFATLKIGCVSVNCQSFGWSNPHQSG